MRSSRKRLSKDDYRLLADFRYVLRQFLSFSEDAATRAGLAPQQHQALLAIKGGGAMSISALAQRLLIRPHSAVGLVDRLVEAKLLKRDTDKQDRRRVLLTLTQTANGVIEALTTTHREEMDRIAPTLKSLLTELDNRKTEVAHRRSR